jgi:phosphoribosylanthranilate isomerase
MVIYNASLAPRLLVHYEIVNGRRGVPGSSPEILTLRSTIRGTLRVMTLVKICGITNPEDARVAADAGADAVGFVFAESPRRVGVEEARRIAIALPDNIIRVGVFVDEEPAEILRISSEVGLDLAQLHGDESPEAVTAIRQGGVKVMKALRVRDAVSLEALDEYEVDLILLDAYSERVRGGTGQRFDWEVAKSSTGRDNIVVSGGLSPENVRNAIEFFEPYGVDASSSLEDEPGRKNSERVRRFVLAARD